MSFGRTAPGACSHAAVHGGAAPFSVGADLRLTAFASQPFNAGSPSGPKQAAHDHHAVSKLNASAYGLSLAGAALFGRVGQRFGLAIFLWPGPRFSGA